MTSIAGVAVDHPHPLRRRRNRHLAPQHGHRVGERAPPPQRSFTLKLSPPLRSAARQRRRRVLSPIGVTKNVNIGCGFNIVPMWHPLRLAEDYAMADILTGGRVIFGVGRGYHTREAETFGAPRLDQNANREMFRGGR